MSAPGLQGLRPWIIQRITAAYIAVFVIYFVASLMLANPLVNADVWSQWVAYPGNNVSLGLFWIALLWHAWIGIRDVVLDYVHNVVSRMLVLTLVASVIVGSGLWGIRTLFLIVAI
jgi:succinate dehydrogenase / fumarate reductase membrane anchor subunit